MPGKRDGSGKGKGLAAKALPESAEIAIARKRRAGERVVIVLAVAVRLQCGARRPQNCKRLHWLLARSLTNDGERRQSAWRRFAWLHDLWLFAVVAIGG